MRWCFRSCRAITAVAAMSCPAHAAVTLEWIAPAECPSDSAVLHAIESQLTPDVGLTTSPALHARMEVKQTDARWEMALFTSAGGHEGSRTVTGKSCQELASAAALIIAMALKAAELSPPAPTPTPNTPTPNTPTPNTPAPTPTPNTPTPNTPTPNTPTPNVGLAAGLQLAAVVGSVPFIGAGPQVSLSVLPSPIRIALSVSGAWSEKSGVGARPDVGVTFRQLMFDLRGCYELPLWRLRLGLCAGPQLGLLEGQSYGVTEPATGAAAWWSVSGGAAVAMPLFSGLSLFASADVGATLLPARFTIENVGAAFQTSPVVGHGAIGLEVQLFPK